MNPVKAHLSCNSPHTHTVCLHPITVKLHVNGLNVCFPLHITMPVSRKFEQSNSQLDLTFALQPGWPKQPPVSGFPGILRHSPLYLHASQTRFSPVTKFRAGPVKCAASLGSPLVFVVFRMKGFFSPQIASRPLLCCRLSS